MALVAFDNDDAKSKALDTWHIELPKNWEDVICPICLDFPHNGVLLFCASHDKGCRPFLCDTDQSHSNCLDRFRSAYGFPSTSKPSSTSNELINGGSSSQGVSLDNSSPATCPLCRGDVTGWIVIDEARLNLNMKKRCCQEKNCSYIGNYLELQDHAKQKHPDSRPSEIDPAQQLDWENFQQSSEIIDVLSTINSEVPHGVVLGDYVIEYGNDTGDEYEDFPGDEGSWWTSCILYQVFDNFRSSRNRRRSRSNGRRSNQRSGYEDMYFDEGSSSSIDSPECTFYDIEDEFVQNGGSGSTESTETSSQRSYRRRRSYFHYH